MTTEQRAKLENVEEVMTRILFELQDQKGCKAEYAKLDTILGKMYKLLHS